MSKIRSASNSVQAYWGSLSVKTRASITTVAGMLGVTAVAAVSAGIASTILARPGSTEPLIGDICDDYATASAKNLAIGLGGFGIGAALMLIGTPGKIRSAAGLGIAAGTGTWATFRHRALNESRSVVTDAQRRLMCGGMPSGLPSGIADSFGYSAYRDGTQDAALDAQRAAMARSYGR